MQEAIITSKTVDNMLSKGMELEMRVDMRDILALGREILGWKSQLGLGLIRFLAKNCLESKLIEAKRPRIWGNIHHEKINYVIDCTMND